jgi:uncharacterized protein (DUF1800 family)
MTYSRRQFLQGRLTQTATPSQNNLVADDPIYHLLNRATYGVRPAELAEAQAMGLAAWVDWQLQPEAIDDSEADAVLRDVPLLQLDRRTLYRLENGDYRAHHALMAGAILRPLHSKRQLYERMVDFWTDHFNVTADDYTIEVLLYQRNVIRPHALGKFRDLLMATAKHPAMLYYLDNAFNYAGNPNENYARELLELHTMGVDGGYSEEDIRQVARAFTGWTVHNNTRTGFIFNDYDHDDGGKLILGHKLPSGRGIEDGLHVLNILANHPATARYVCWKLCVRFVSDNPPDSLVASLAQVWLETDGDIRAILRHLFNSDEFLAAAGMKFRRPLAWFVGALRATGTVVGDFYQLEEMLQELGQPPYGWHPPNGYPDVAGAWQSTNGLLARWNIAMRLTHGAYSDPFDLGEGMVRTEIFERVGVTKTVGDFVDAVAEQVFGTALTGADRQFFVEYVLDGGDDADTKMTTRLSSRKLGSLYGLMLASPLYQWR